MSFPNAPPPQVPQLLEVNVISAQDLAPISRSMRTYAVAWVHPNRKLSTRVDTHGQVDPTWNDKFVFRVDDSFLHSDTSAVMVDIYALSWFRDVRVGTVRVLVGNLIPPSASPNHNIGVRFVALQVRRPSGRPQGILNIGVALLDSSMRSMPLYTHLAGSALGYLDLMGGELETSNHPHHQRHLSQVPLRRARSERTETFNDDMSEKPGSIINGSELGGPPIKMITTTGSVYTESEVGPSPSVVAAGLAEDRYRGPEAGSSVVEDWIADDVSIDGLKSKLERWRTELSPVYDNSGGGARRRRGRHARRHTDGDVGLFSCFGSTCGFECTIVIGPGPRKKKAQHSPPDSLLLT